jgi:hypothetical protein
MLTLTQRNSSLDLDLNYKIPTEEMEYFVHVYNKIEIKTNQNLVDEF